MNSQFKKIIISILLLSLIVFLGSYIDIQGDTDLEEITSTYDNDKIDEIIFPQDEVVSVNVQIDADDYADLLSTAEEKNYYTADITYNGETIENVGIRTKGNSSLKDVYKAEGDRYSLNVDFNYYIDQDFYGITELNLNNMFEDPSYIAEYLAYEALKSIGGVSARTTFIELSINGEYFGLYLSIEEIDEDFISNNYTYDEGNLYKPDSADDSVSTGADLAYVDSDIDTYTAFDEVDNDSVLDLIEAIDDQENLDDVFNVDGFLQYLAMSTYMIHLDAYQGGMFHNYYLYDNNGIYEWITWDLNMVFNNFPGGSFTDEEVINFLIDEPVKGDMSNYPLIEAIFSNEEYVEIYHSYLEELSNNYLNPDDFEIKVNELYELIKDSVRNQSSVFYTYEEFEASIYEDDFNLIDFITLRTESILLQLDGELPSTNNSLGNVSTGVGTIDNAVTPGINNTMEQGNLPPMGNDMSTNQTNIGIEEDVDTTTSGESIFAVIFGVILLLGGSFFIKSRMK